MSVCLSVYLFAVCLSVCMSVCLSVYLSVFLSIYLSISINLPALWTAIGSPVDPFRYTVILQGQVCRLVTFMVGTYTTNNFGWTNLRMIWYNEIQFYFDKKWICISEINLVVNLTKTFLVYKLICNSVDKTRKDFINMKVSLCTCDLQWSLKTLNISTNLRFKFW